MAWIIDHLLWDTRVAARPGITGALWAARKLLAAFAGAALLTWVEWVEHHPSNLIAVMLIHFVFVLAAIALLVQIGQWFQRARQDSYRNSRRPKRDA